MYVKAFAFLLFPLTLILLLLVSTVLDSSILVSVNSNKICLLSRVLLWLEKMAGSVTPERNYDEKTHHKGW